MRFIENTLKAKAEKSECLWYDFGSCLTDLQTLIGPTECICKCVWVCECVCVLVCGVCIWDCQVYMLSEWF